jgi:hypothetical protein
MTDSRINGFFILTGFSIAAFASGFSVCLFQLDHVNECVALANSWVDVFRSMGDHIIAWAFAIGRAAFRQ